MDSNPYVYLFAHSDYPLFEILTKWVKKAAPPNVVSSNTSNEVHAAKPCVAPQPTPSTHSVSDFDCKEPLPQLELATREPMQQQRAEQDVQWKFALVPAQHFVSWLSK